MGIGSAAGGVGEGGGGGNDLKAEKMSFLTALRLALFKEPSLDHQPASTTWAKPALCSIVENPKVTP